jgi:hypothetical protein
LREEFSFESELPGVLAGQGFHVVDGAWSPSTWSLVAIPSLLNLEVPLINGDGLNVADSAALYEMVTGNARLFSMFHEAGYRLTYIEGGWVGSVCGEIIDVCIRRPFVDEAIQTVLDRSLLGDLGERWWGHAFARAGLRSLSEVDGLLQGLATNGTRDMVFAHVMLPHGPYVLESDCSETGIRTIDPLDEVTVQVNGAVARAAYLDHVRCVDHRLAEIVDHVPDSAAIVITGDHGTLFRGQMLREAADWTQEDIAERARTFLATKLPASCGRNSTVSSSLEALMDASDCLLGTRLDRASSEKLWLLGRGVTPRCIKQPDKALAIVDIPC